MTIMRSVSNRPSPVITTIQISVGNPSHVYELGLMHNHEMD